MAMDSSSEQERLLITTTEQSGDLKSRVCVESKKIWKVALPSVISRITSFGTIVVTQSFIGHISSVDLAGYALVQTLTVRFVNGIVIGMSSATETLCGQAYGAKQYHMMGIYLQRSWLIDLITLTLLLPIFVFATPIFNLLGQDEAIARSAGHISLWFVLFLYSIMFASTIQMYLQAQQKNLVIAWLSVMQFVIHIPLSWLFVYVLDWGVAGAMGALCISSWFLVFGEFVYIFGGWCPDSWKGFSLAALKDIFPVLKLSISSGVMVCLELWYYAILVLLAGYMKNAEVSISAFSICLNIFAWEFMICLGLMGAAIVRVANELGRGDAKATKFSIKVLMSTSFTIGLLLWGVCLVFGNKLGYLFTNDKEVADAVSDLSLLLAFAVLLNGIYPVLSGVAVGAGLQTKVAVINLVCFYVIGLPIGAVLGYVLQFQVKGIWVGMMSGVVTETVALSLMTWKTNWDEEVSKTSARLKRWYLESSNETMDNSARESLLDETSGLKVSVFGESKKIWKVALPSIISKVTSFGILVVTQSFVGHISALDLAGYALVQTLIVRFVHGVVIGMSSATETLCGQAFGAKQYHMMGIYLQRSWLIDFITLTILLPIFVFATPMFNLLGQDEGITKSAGNISLWFIPFMYSIMFAMTIQMFLQAQQKNLVIAWLSVMQFVIHIVLSWLFVYVFHWGIHGAMGALSISSWCLVFGEFVYILGGWCPDSWKGFSSAAFKDMLPVVKLSISSGVMICLELWYYAILVLLAGYMKNAEVSISAFSICLNFAAWEFMISVGIAGAGVVRVANELGKGDAKATKFSIKVLMSTSLLIALIFLILCLVFGDKLGYLFTNDDEVAHAVADLYVLVAVSVFLNGIYPVLSGVTIGAGLQGKVAIINLVCFYVIGLPVGAVLGYVAHLQVKGIWIGMISGVVTQTIALSCMTWKIDWDEEVSKTSARLKRWYLKSSDESN